MPRKATLVLLTCLLMVKASGEAKDWSDWTPAIGSSAINYRWRFSSAGCLANGCFKDLQFRNDASKELVFKFAAHVERMGDGDAEDTETGSTTVNAGSISGVLSLGKGGKLLRVLVEVQ